MQKIKNNIWSQIFIIYTRYLIGGAFVFSSLIKIKGGRFTAESGAENPVDSAWHFFETMYQSGLYWKFIGFGQLLAGFLLMTQRFAKLGALVNFPIILNIFVITLSYYFAFTPVITGLMLFANLVLIAWDWNELRVLFNLKPVLVDYKRLEKFKIWEISGFILFLFTFAYRAFINQYHLGYWLIGCTLIGITGLVVGLRKNKKRKATES